MTRRDVERLYAMPRSVHNSYDLTLMCEGNERTFCEGEFFMVSTEFALRAPYRGKSQHDAEMTREAYPPGVGGTLSVTEDDVGTHGESGENFHKGRNFPKGEKTGDIRETKRGGLSLIDRLFCQGECGGTVREDVERKDGDRRNVAISPHVNANICCRNDPWRAGRIAERNSSVGRGPQFSSRLPTSALVVKRSRTVPIFSERCLPSSFGNGTDEHLLCESSLDT